MGTGQGGHRTLPASVILISDSKGDGEPLRTFGMEDCHGLTQVTVNMGIDSHSFSWKNP